MLSKCKLALWITLGVTVLVTVLRCVLTPLMQSMDTGMFAFNYVTMGIMLAAFIGVGILLYLYANEIPTLPTFKAPWLSPMALLLMVAGLTMLVVSVIELYNWSANGIAPPPRVTPVSGAERTTLFLSLALGILSGVYFLRLGFYFFSENAEVRGAYPLWALAPAFWIWMRLARYEVSYASAVGIHESFFDFAMLLCTMLFLFSLARQMSDVDGKPWKTVWFGCGTIMMTVSGTVSRVVFFLLGQGDAYRTGQLAGVPDLVVGVVTVAFVLYWVLTPQERKVPSKETE